MTKKSTIYVVLMAIVCFSMMACNMIDLGDYIPVTTPKALVEVGYESKMSLNEATEARQDYIGSFEKNLVDWTKNIDEKGKLKATIEQYTYTTWETLAPGLGALGPVGLFGLSVGGVFMKRPKDVKLTDHEKAKQDAYKQGLEAAKAAAGLDNLAKQATA